MYSSSLKFKERRAWILLLAVMGQVEKMHTLMNLYGGVVKAVSAAKRCVALQFSIVLRMVFQRRRERARNNARDIKEERLVF